jgi:hypothetical protein
MNPCLSSFNTVAAGGRPGRDGGRPTGLPQTPYAGSLQRSRNTLPKARQRQGPPDPDVITAVRNNTTYGSRTFSNSNRYPSAGGSGRNMDEVGSNNTLPRAARQDSRSRRGGDGVGEGGQYSSYGTLPRTNRQQRGGGRGRPQSWYGGNGGSLPRPRGGRLQEPGMPPRAPSQRVIYRSRRQGARRNSGAERIEERIRARSLPRPTAAVRDSGGGGGDMSAAKSLGTIWSPDGKCPSFADILKRSSCAGSTELMGDKRGNFKYIRHISLLAL